MLKSRIRCRGVMRSLIKCCLRLEKCRKKIYQLESRSMSMLHVNSDFTHFRLVCVPELCHRHNVESRLLVKQIVSSASCPYSRYSQLKDHQSYFDIEERFKRLVFVKIKMRLEKHLRKLVDEDVQCVLRLKEVNEDNLDEKVEELCQIYYDRMVLACATIIADSSDEKGGNFSAGKLPLRLYEDLVEFDERLSGDMEFRKFFIQYLRTMKDGTAKTTIRKMIGATIKDAILCMYSGQGLMNTPKLNFADTELCKIIINEVAEMFPLVESHILKRYIGKKIYQDSLNIRYRKKTIYQQAMEKLAEVRQETLEDSADHTNDPSLTRHRRDETSDSDDFLNSNPEGERAQS